MVLLCCGGTILLFASLHDVAFRTVPNWMALGLLLVGIAVQIANNTLLFGVVGGLLILLGASFCWRRGWLGGGDVKLLGACALLVPPSLAVGLLLDIALAGGILAIIYLTLSKFVTPSLAPRPRGLLRRICRMERYRIHRRRPLPYASAIAVGTLVAVLTG